MNMNNQIYKEVKPKHNTRRDTRKSGKKCVVCTITRRTNKTAKFFRFPKDA